MPLIVPANEQGAGFMAAGYARASGRSACAMVTSGPGATNTVTPVRDCMADSMPDRRDLRPGADGRDRHATRSRKRPCPRIMGSVAKHVFLVTDPAKLEATVRTAFEIARTGRPGPGGHRRAEGRAELAGRVPRRRAACRSPGYRQRSTRVTDRHLGEAAAEDFFDMLRRVRAAADLRRRRRHQRRVRRTRCASSPRRSASRWSPR